MVDAFLDAGYTYFDTSFVYHNEKSEEATRKALVERHLRDSFTVATKFPTFNLVPEEEIDGIFQSQLDNLGVDYIDYYLLHNIQNVYYDGYDGNGGIVFSLVSVRLQVRKTQASKIFCKRTCMLRIPT